MELKEIEEKLKAPFRPDEIEFRITAKTKDKSKGLAAAYIQARAVQNRLDEVIGFNNWKNEFIVTEKGKICGLSLRIEGEWITKYDGASDTKIEATKGGLSDSMKRAAVQWGIGRYLYNLPAQWVKIKNTYGDNYEIVERPILPDWALPNDLKQKQPNFKEINQGAEVIPYKNKLDDDIQNCFEAFKRYKVTEAEILGYLCMEKEMITEKDLITLRAVYQAISKGQKQKDDFFKTPETAKKGQQTLKLESKLGG